MNLGFIFWEQDQAVKMIDRSPVKAGPIAYTGPQSLQEESRRSRGAALPGKGLLLKPPHHTQSEEASHFSRTNVSESLAPLVVPMWVENPALCTTPSFCIR